MTHDTGRRPVFYVLSITEPQLFEEALQGVVVGSSQGAVPTFRPVRFPDPPSEPDVRLSPHRALHVSMPMTMQHPDLVSPTAKESSLPGSGNE